jgi:hypothetical protein
MTKEAATSHHLSNLSRRDFLKLAGAATASVMLADCRSGKSPTATPTTAPTATPTSAPTTTLVPDSAIRRPEIIRFYPDVKSKVVHTHHAGVWTGTPQGGVEDNDLLNPEALRQMLDASITELTGLDDAREAWAALFAPDERVAIKVNTLFSQDCTHLPLVLAVVECLQEAGVPAEQIVIFDANNGDLRSAGYPVNEDGPGVRCHGANYTTGWKIADVDISLSSVLLNCDALINMPILTGIVFFGAGISFAMKNHFGTFDQPQRFHGQRFVLGVTELNALPPIKERTRLVIGDILTAGAYRSYYGRLVVGGDTILMSFDPVAHDTLGMQIAADAYAAEGSDPTIVTDQATPWLMRAVELGLGTDDPENVDLVEVNLG